MTLSNVSSNQSLSAERSASENQRELAPAVAMKSRQLKVSYLGADLPYLRLKGNWLDQAGFPIGVNVQVIVTPGRLILETIEDLHPSVLHKCRSR